VPTEPVERRRVARRTPDPQEALSRVRLRAGREMTVVDISPLGAQVEGIARLLPGTHLDVHVTGAGGRVPVRARVTRCAVWRLAADAVCYRGAMAFNVPVELPPIEVAEGDAPATAAPEAPAERPPVPPALDHPAA
jgi:hypothetical protein